MIIRLNRLLVSTEMALHLLVDNAESLDPDILRTFSRRVVFIRDVMTWRAFCSLGAHDYRGCSDETRVTTPLPTVTGHVAAQRELLLAFCRLSRSAPPLRPEGGRLSHLPVILPSVAVMGRRMAPRHSPPPPYEPRADVTSVTVMTFPCRDGARTRPRITMRLSGPPCQIGYGFRNRPPPPPADSYSRYTSIRHVWFQAGFLGQAMLQFPWCEMSWRVEKGIVVA